MMIEEDRGTAKEIVKKYGKKLIGMTVNTQGMGSYPGGNAIVSDVDREDDLVMHIRDTWTDAEGFKKQGIGVFAYEEVVVLRKGMDMKEYAVIVIDDNGKIGCHQVVASTPLNSFWVLAKKLDFDFECVCSMPWNAFKLMSKRKDFDFAGDSLVSKETVLEQPEVFNHRRKRANKK